MNQVNGVVLKIGQVWLDRDRRTEGKRQVEIVEVNADGTRVKVKSNTGPSVWIKAARFTPKNFKIVKDVEVPTGVSSAPPSAP